jgi:hypothetical protein
VEKIGDIHLFLSLELKAFYMNISVAGGDTEVAFAVGFTCTRVTFRSPEFSLRVKDLHMKHFTLAVHKLTPGGRIGTQSAYEIEQVMGIFFPADPAIVFKNFRCRMKGTMVARNC